MRTVFFFLVLFLSGVAFSSTVENLIAYYAAYYNVDPDLALAVAKVESNLDQTVVSPRGAIGVMQLTAETARDLNVNPYVLWQNVAGGVLYLRKMLDKYGDLALALAAYNAGPSVVDRYGGIPPYRETRVYVRRVLSLYRKLKKMRVDNLLSYIAAAAVRYKVPPDVLKKIAETSRGCKYAVESVNGKLVCYDSVQKAVRAVEKMGYAARVGIMLVSTKWLPMLGCSLANLFDVGYNVFVAAWILARSGVDLWTTDTRKVVRTYRKLNGSVERLVFNEEKR